MNFMVGKNLNMRFIDRKITEFHALLGFLHNEVAASNNVTFCFVFYRCEAQLHAF